MFGFKVLLVGTDGLGVMALYLGLVHYPVYNKNYDTIASAVTTVDLHDLARVGRTYGVRGIFIVTPLADQQRLVERVLDHWTRGFGATYNPHRKEALDLVAVCSSIEEADSNIMKIEKERPLVMATDASRVSGRMVTYAEAHEMLRAGKLIFLLFGTAWGLTREVLEQADYVLEPVWGVANYNHLSVRTAAAIIVDRIAGRI